MSTSCDVLMVALADVTRDARTLNLARALARRGLRVAVVGEYSLLREEPFEQICWQDPGGRAIKRWWSLTRFVASLRITTNLVMAMDVFALAAASAMSRSQKMPLFYDMRELNFALGPLGGKGLKQTIITRHEQRRLRDVHTVIVSGELDADLVQERFGLAVRPTVLLNTPPYMDVVPSPLREKCGVDESTPLVIYQGVVHHGRGLEPFFRAMQTMPSVHIAVLGEGPAATDLRNRAEQLGVRERVHWLGSVPYDQLHAYTCGADVGLCLIEPLSLSYEYALPNKLFEYMNARIPSIVSDLPAMHDHIQRHPVGVLVGKELRADDIAAACMRALGTPDRNSMIQACETIRDLAYDKQSAEVVAMIHYAVGQHTR